MISTPAQLLQMRLSPLRHPTFGSRTMGHHFVLALCVAYVLLLRVACAPCPIVDPWFQAFWTCDPFLLDAQIEVFAGSSDPFAHFAASVGAISARSPLSWCRQPQETHVCWPAARSAAIFERGHNVRLCMTWKQMKAARSRALRSCIEKKEAGSLKKCACVGQQREVLLFSGDLALSCQSHGKNGTK